MTPKIGYLLPTRESVMEGRPQAAPLLQLAERAEALGYESIWVGDSLLARPRHEPLALLAAAAARTRRVALGTAVLLPALRNPVLLAHQAATIDQIAEGRLILGCGIAADFPNVRSEFRAAGVPWEKRVGRMLEGLRLCRRLWRGETVNWDGRWDVRDGVLGPTPHRPGGPPVWLGGGGEANIPRVGREFDGWFPNSPDPDGVGADFAAMRETALGVGRDPDSIACAAYLTVAVDDDAARANRRIDDFLQTYYGAPADLLRRHQACHGGSLDDIVAYVGRYVAAGASHIVLRFPGAHERHLETMADLRQRLAG